MPKHSGLGLPMGEPPEQPKRLGCWLGEVLRLRLGEACWLAVALRLPLELA